MMVAYIPSSEPTIYKNLEYINLRSSPFRSLEPKQASKSLMSPDLVDKHWRRLKEHMFQKRLIDILIEKY